MDAFVIRKERPKKTAQNSKVGKKKLKQITIEALPRVVVVEEIERLSTTLSEENQNIKSIISALQELKNIKPSKEILISTKIGHRINALRRHENESVKSLARDVFKDWKRFYREQRQRPVLEVRSDAKSELLRMKARKLLADSLEKEVTSALPELIERNIYHICSRKPDVLYKRKVRKICFHLKHNIATREQVCSGELSIEDLCKNYVS